ncbi:MAG TPA: DUF6624 domain-containing protein, partial [Gammaproteobacteria bacterium]|nr:DUF6624 domain-containing protein [Gammaproteobacteria bacterium]
MSTKRLLPPFVVFLVCTAAFAQGGFDNTLRTELIEMGHRDQEVRQRASVLIRGLPEAAEEFKAAVAQQNEIDAANFQRLEALVAEHGWPGKRLVGEEASRAALIILQHASLKQQQQYLPVLRAAVEEGAEPGTSLAVLEDGIAQAQGTKQIYGTRVVSDSDGKPMLYPVDDPANVDARRQAVGLPPLKEQLRQME